MVRMKRADRTMAIRKMIEKGELPKDEVGVRREIYKKVKNHPLFTNVAAISFPVVVNRCIHDIFDAISQPVKKEAESPELPIEDSHDLESLDDALANFPLTLSEVDSLRPMLARIKMFLLPQWDKLVRRAHHVDVYLKELDRQNVELKRGHSLQIETIKRLDSEISKLKREAGVAEDMNAELFAANAKLSERIEVFKKEAEKKSPEFKPEKHMAVHSNSTRM